jgi:AcrR family transcriptional regulator
METGPGEPAAGEQADAPRALYKRLPRGPHRLDRDAVARHQRVRIHGAMVRAVAASGYEAVTVGQVIALAGVSRRSFYEQFASKQACFLATFDEIAGQHLAAARRACALTPGGPNRRLHVAIGTCAEAVADDPEPVALTLLDALSAGAPGALRLRAASAAWERLLCASLSRTPLLPAPSGTSAAALLGGMHGILAARLGDGGAPSRRRVQRDLGWWALAPKLPAQETQARRVISLLRDDGRRAALAATTRSVPRPLRSDRERVLSAALRVAARDPAAALSPARIADEAGVPLGAFFELFDNRDACLRAAIADAGEQLLAIAEGAAERGSGQPAALRETLALMLSHLAREPLHARAVTMLAPCGGPACRDYGARLETELARRLGTGFGAASELAGAAIVGGIWHLVRCHLADRRIRRLPAAAGPLTLLALAPALGPDGAAEALRAG